MKKQAKSVGKKNANLLDRRNFLTKTGMAAAGTGIFLVSCHTDFGPLPPQPEEEDVFDLGGGDLGVLNYAYALEQLEADFYTRVLDGSYWASADATEKIVFEDLRNHEVIHREFFKTALNAVISDKSTILPTLEFDWSGVVDFASRDSVLGVAKLLEDTGVRAYNGAGKVIETADYLVIAGKIVSVEARHASAIRSLINPDSADFSGDDVVDMNGLDLASDPSDVLADVVGLNIIQTPFTANQLP